MQCIVPVWVVFIVFGLHHGTTARKPVMTPSVDEIVIQEGDKLELTCQGECSITFSTQKLTGKAERLENKMVLYDQISRTYTLIRLNATKEDTGWYACAEDGIDIQNDEQTINRTDTDISWIYVYVNSSAPFAVASHVIIPIPVVAGRSAVIPCRPTTPGWRVRLNSSATGAPVDWPYDPKIGYIIEKVAQAQKGIHYECTSDGTYNTNDPRSRYTLRILEAGMITGKKVVRVKLLQPATLWCYVEGYSLRNFSWVKIGDSKSSRNSNIKGNPTFVNTAYVEMSLNFMGATREDNGTYECRAIEYVGSLSYQISLIVTEVPEVRIRSASAISRDSIRLSWTVRDGNDPVRRYSIQQLKAKTDTWVERWSQSEELGMEKSYFIVRGLEKGSAYKFRMTASNTIGISNPAYSPFIQTLDQDFEFHPEIWIRETSNTSITVGYSVANEISFRDIFRYYELRVSNSRSTRDVILEIAGLEPYTFEDLETGEEYRLSVAACNDNTEQCGSWSAEVETIVMDRDPKFIPNITLVESALHSIKIIWSMPPPELQDRVHQYKVEAETIQEKKKRTSYVTNGTTNMFIFRDIEAKTTYLLKVAACSEYKTQCGNWSSGIEAFTVAPGLDPKYVVAPRIAKTFDTEIVLEWSELPTKLWDSVHCLKIEVAQENETKGRSYVDPYENMTTLTQLETGKNYSMKVAVCSNCGNSQNCSAWSKGMKTTVRNRDPIFVPSVTVDEVSFESIKINWSSPPLELQDRVHQYQMVIQKLQAKAMVPVYVLRTENSYTFRDLEAKTTYLLKVAACSEYKTQCGNWSLEKEVLTPTRGEEKGVDVKLLVGLIVAVLISFGLAVWMGIRSRGERAARRRFIEASIEVFKTGALHSLDPKLTIANQAELLPYDKKWEFPRKLLKLDRVLGSGAFGIVKKGYAESISRKRMFTTVAVKMVRATQSLEHMTALSRELKILGNLGKHLNIVNLLGACTKRISYGELLVIVEFCRFGNLRDYLLHRRSDFVDKNDTDAGNVAGTSGIKVSFNANHSSWSPDTTDSDPDYVTEECGRNKAFEEISFEVDNSPPDPDTDDVEPGLVSKYRVDFKDEISKPIGPRDLLSWAWQVSKGMKYLGSKKVMHGDLAARNILLADNKVVKICDFGLAKSLYANSVYKKEGHGPLPIKWMAIESIKDRLFSVKSDVWSYGVVLWEFFSLAETPYPGISNENVYNKLIEGFRMERPEYAVDVMYSVMLRCWNADPSERPSFEEIEAIIHDFLDEGVKKDYIDLDAAYAEINAESLLNQSPDVLTMSPAEYTSFMTQPCVDPSTSPSEGTSKAE